MKVKTPANGMARAFGTVVVGTSDGSDLAHRTQKIQTARLHGRFIMSPALAEAVAGHCYGVSETWRSRV